MLDGEVTSSEFAQITGHTGTVFYGVLQQAHELLRPQSYLEIGTATGASLALAHCPSIAIDPQFRIDTDVVGDKPACLMFQMGSDVFFKNHNPVALLGRTIDMAFLDGMHLFEFLIRDFINTERHCLNNSVVFMHDCLPTDSHVARRFAGADTQADLSPTPSWWAGDLWKAVLILKEYRPDLKIMALDAPPTGLLAVTNLDPASTVLTKSYFEAIEKYRDMMFTQDVLDHYIKKINVMSTDVFNSLEHISKYFWI